MTELKRFQLRNHFSFFFIFFIFSSLFMTSTISAQTHHSMYLNKIGDINLEVGYDVQVAGDYAYVTNNDGVMVVDVSNPRNPTKVSEISTTQAPFAVGVYGENCFVAFGNGEFRISDISSPSNPQTVISSSVGSGIVTKIVIVDSYVYVSLRGVGYRILNFTGTSLDLVYTYSDSQGESLAVKDDLLYFGNPNAGVKVFNISSVTTPNYIRTLSTSTSVWDMDIHENLLFVGCHGAGFRIYSLSNPTNPSLLEIHSEDDGGEAQGVVGNSSHLFVADNWGVEAYDMSTPSSPVEVAEVTRGIGAAHDLDIDDRYVYVALGGGLDIFELSSTRSRYFPPYLYYVIPISTVVLGGGIYLIIRYRKRKKSSKS